MQARGEAARVGCRRDPGTGTMGLREGREGGREGEGGGGRQEICGVVREGRRLRGQEGGREIVV